MILIPAYGRDYKTAAAVRADWDAGKDFKIASIGPSGGRYINNADAQRYGIEAGSYIRYDCLTELTFIGIWEEREELEEV